MKMRGSAMLIAFFLMVAIGAVAFSVGRIFILDNMISSLYENGAVAYYAAESGIEEGLIRYRFDTNFDLPAGNSLENPMLFSRASVSDSSSLLAEQSIDPTAAGNTVDDPSEIVYDLNATNKTRFYGNDVSPEGGDGLLTTADITAANYSSGENSIYHITRDESVKIVINNAQDFNLIVKMSNYKWKTGDVSHPDANSAFIEAKATGTFSNTFSEKKKALVIWPNNLNFLSESVVRLNTDAANPNVFTLNNLISWVAGATINNATKAELTLKPVGCDIDIAISPVSSDSMSSPWTTLKSIGYYGDATRTLTAKIDRQSGTVYDLYDFIVYKHGV